MAEEDHIAKEMSRAGTGSLLPPRRLTALAIGAGADGKYEPGEVERFTEDVLGAMTSLLEREDIPSHDPDRWFRLALALAIRHEPTLQVARPSAAGQPRKWKEWDLIALWARVRKSRLENPDLSEADVLRQIVQVSSPGNSQRQAARLKTLKNRLSESKRSPLVGFIQRAIEAGVMREAQLFAALEDLPSGSVFSRTLPTA